MNRMLVPGTALALMLGAVAGGSCFAQETYPNAPFREHPALLAQAVGLRRIAVVAQAYARPAPEAESNDAAAAGEEEGPREAAAPLFMASLAAKAPEIAEALDAALGALLEARAAGEDTAAAAKQVADLTARAEAALLPAGIVDTAPFRGALLAALLLGEGGVAESYEAAAEGEAEGYAIGWTALQRAKLLWDGLKGQGVPESVAEGDAALAQLDALFPSAEMPARLSPDPEEAESPAHRLVGLTEAVTRADLYPARDLGAAAGAVRGLAAEGCALLASDAALGRERLAIAAGYYDQLLADPLSVMAPEEVGKIATGFGAGEEEGGDAAPDCGALLDALGTAREALGS